MTAQQLKNSILQMAVQGKLVPQDPNDEPASVLLERIRAEKERLIKEKKIKREKTPSVIFKGADNTPYEKIGDEVRSLADEVPFDIPDSWEWVRLQTIATSSLGKTLDKAKNKGDLKPYLCSINVYWDGIDLTTVKEARLEECELPKYLLRPGDLLICEGGDVGRSAVWESTQEMYYQNALHRVRFYGGINPHYFQLLLECYKGNQILDAYSKGMTIKHLVQTALNTIVFPLPPLSEQTRIVGAVNRLLPYLHSYNRAEQNLTELNTAFPEALKKSILQEAVQGKLVPQDPSDEPASVLLERIRAEKQRLIKEGKIKKDKHESVIFRRDNSHYEKLDGVERCIDGEIPFEIPENWCWCRASCLGTMIRGRGIKRTETVAQGCPCIRYGEIYTTYETSFDSAVSFVPETLDKDCLHFSSGDVVFTLTGENKVDIAKTVAFLGDGRIAAGGDLAFWTHHGMNPLYLVYYMASPYCIELKRRTATGDIIVHISTSKVGDFLVPIPPLNEQHRIVQRIEAVLPLVVQV